MQQYLKLLKEIKSKGTWKNPSRPNLPRTLSLFGYQYQCDLFEGFPFLTTKEMSFKILTTELLWFLRGGDPLNIKYLLDNGVNIWNKDAYGYYLGKIKEYDLYELSLNNFVKAVKNGDNADSLASVHGGIFLRNDYILGDCPLGYELWRNFNGIDQISQLITNLKNKPEDRGHLLSAYDPAQKDVALRPCHILAQWNCRKLTAKEREHLYIDRDYENKAGEFFHMNDEDVDNYLNERNFPSYYLDCQLYQRSADVFLGVPYNTASYSLLTHILAEICGYLPGVFTHTFGDVHIYEDHMKAVDLQLERNPTKLPKLNLGKEFENMMVQYKLGDVWNTSELFHGMKSDWFSLEGYEPKPKISANLSTGL